LLALLIIKCFYRKNDLLHQISLNDVDCRLTHHRASGLVQKRISSIIISLDGIKQVTHDDFRGVKGAYNSTIEVLKIIKNSSLPLRINTIMMKENDEEIGELIDFAYENLGAVSVAVAPILNSGKGKDVMKSNLAPQRVYEIQKRAYKGNNNLIQLNQYDENNNGQCTHCGVFEHMLHVSPNLEVSLCPTMTKYESSVFKLAELKNSTLEECLDKLKTFKGKFECEKKSTCEFFGLCKSGCRSRAYLQTGKICGVDSYLCEFFSEHKKDNLMTEQLITTKNNKTSIR